MHKSANGLNGEGLVSGDIVIGDGSINISNDDGIVKIDPTTITPKDQISDATLFYFKKEQRSNFIGWTRIGLEFLFIYDLSEEFEESIKRALLKASL